MCLENCEFGHLFFFVGIVESRNLGHSYFEMLQFNIFKMNFEILKLWHVETFDLCNFQTKKQFGDVLQFWDFRRITT